ncbi:MAG: DUF1501 domain-containing protein [Bacteroidota bacterium]
MKHSDAIQAHLQRINRRSFLSKSGMGLGAAALAYLSNPLSAFAGGPSSLLGEGGIGKPHFASTAKRVIYLFQAGGPSQMDLFQYKPLLNERHGEEIPESVVGKQRISGMTAFQGKFPLTGSMFSFQQYGESGAWMSELMPHTAGIVDDLCFVHTVNTNAINHDPGITFMQTGSEQAGRPCFGSWISYGLGRENDNLPAFVVLLSRHSRVQTTLSSNLWSNGFLPSHHQGVQFRSGKDPVPYLNNPAGIDRSGRREALDFISAVNRLDHEASGDPHVLAQIEQYEMAYRMQRSVPDVTDLSDEPSYILDMYGEDVHIPGSYASNCLRARRLAEEGVKFIQLYHMGWDHHSNLPSRIRATSKQTDQASAALIKDLKQRGLLEDTLVIWGGEFGRTAFSQGGASKDDYGRDHHPRCFSVWMAGGGVKPGLNYGKTDAFGYNIVQDPVHVHDLMATALHTLGLDHERLTFRHQGRRYRLTDVHGQVMRDLLG